MEIYKNLGRDSGVESYEIGDDFIIVKFLKIGKNGRGVYKYSHVSAGIQNVNEMKRLAYCGEGLNSFINKNVKNLYVKE